MMSAPTRISPSPSQASTPPTNTLVTKIRQGKAEGLVVDYKSDSLTHARTGSHRKTKPSPRERCISRHQKNASDDGKEGSVHHGV